MVDGLERLRHDPVIRRDDDHRNVRDACPPCPHRREGLVARCVEEGQLPIAVVHLVRADVLGDASGLSGGDLGLANRVEP